MITRLLFLLLTPAIVLSQNTLTVSGFVNEEDTRESLPGVTVFSESISKGTSTNNFGFYSLSFPKPGKYKVRFSFVGYQTIEKEIEITADIEYNIQLRPGNQLEEVVVSAQKQNNRVSDTPQMSQISVPITQIKKIPALLGEKDVLKVLQLMPGVQSGSEGQAGIYVRGGGPDQNLLILDDATVYNANHLFGFFSVFNGDALKSVQLTKGGFPAQYGGRLSSVIEMQMKDGNKEKLSGEGGIGLIASRLTLEGPLNKKKNASFLISGRRTYLDILAKPFIKSQLKKDNGGEGTGSAGYFFQDLNAKIHYDFGRKNKLYLSGFFGKDDFNYKFKDSTSSQTSGLSWGNKTGTLRWNHLFNSKLFANTSFIYSNFRFGIGDETKGVDRNDESYSYYLDYLSIVRDLSLKTDFDYFLNDNHQLKFGFQTTRHFFRPNALVTSGSDTPSVNVQSGSFVSLESGIYGQDTWQIGNRVKLNYGLRYSIFDTGSKTYGRLEPRLSGALILKPDLSFKASYAKMNQYIHLLSNTGIGLPTDLWVPTTDRVAPQQSEQLAIGFAKDLLNDQLTFTLEAYSKKMNNIISYKEGASFLELDGSNQNFKDFQDQITSGKGWSNGLELMLQKKTGRLSGWIGYTLSKTEWQFDELNEGEKFFPKYDRRHDISVVAIYELSKRITLSGTWVYGTGNALTIPVSTFASPNLLQPYYQTPSSGNPTNIPELSNYGERNAFRAEPYHRLDLAIQFHKQKKRHERTWEFGLYNAYSRRNPFFYEIGNSPFLGQRSSGVQLKRISIFPVIPSFSYNFKF